MTDNLEKDITPLGLYFGFFTKHYISILSNFLEHLPIDRFFYPLYLIGKNSGKITQKDLTEILNSDKVTINRIVDFLLENDVIFKEVNPEDKRSYNLKITKSAEKYIEEIEQAITKTDELFLGTIKNKENFNEVICNLYTGLKDKNIDDISFIYEKRKKTKSDE